MHKQRQRITSGLPRLDAILGGVFIGDNVVMYDESGNLAMVFWHQFIASSLAENKPVIFISFDRSPKNLFERLGAMGRNPLLTVLDCFTYGKGKGIDTFLRYLEDAPPEISQRVVKVENPSDPNALSEKLYATHAGLTGDVRLVFESLTGMQEIWGGEDLVAEFYTHSCPRLYDLSTVACWVAEKGAHSRRLRARINQIAQVAVELSIRRGTTALSVLKAESREPEGLQQPYKYYTRGSEVVFPGQREATAHQNLGARIKALRVRRGFSQAELAKLVGVTPSTISQVESSTIYPSVPGLMKMAEVLSVSPGFFFGQEDHKSGRAVIPGPEATRVRLDQAAFDDLAARLLTPMDFGGKAEPYIIEFPANREIAGHFLAHRGQEMGYVLSGKLEIGVAGAVETAEEGDLVYLTTQIPAFWRNPGPDTARLLWVKLV